MQPREGRRRLRGNLKAARQHLKGCAKEGDKLFSRVCCDRARGNGFKLKERRFRLDRTKEFCNKKGGEAVAQAAQRGGEVTLLGGA